MSDEHKCVPNREKYWDELTIEEKIERMRGEVKQLRRKCERLERAQGGLRQHQHATDGEILVPYNERGQSEDAPMVPKNWDAWF